jgi:hypothetical protein
MIAKVIPINRVTPSTTGILAEQLESIGIQPQHMNMANVAEDHLISRTFDVIRSGLSEDVALTRLAEARSLQRFRFSIDYDPDNAEMVGYRPQLVVGEKRSALNEEVLGIHVSPRAIGRFLEPFASLARACELVDSTRPDDEGYAKVVRVATSSSLALALSYAVFCEFGKFDVRKPSASCPELDAIAELSGIPVGEEELSGLRLREVGLRFAGGVAMNYMSRLAAESFDSNEPSQPSVQDNTILFNLILKSMALKDKVLAPHTSMSPVSYALEQAYTPAQLKHIGNVWFRVSE